jgi:hypothetical protein
MDFSATNNPNGVWSYGYSMTLGSPLVLHADRLKEKGVDIWRTDIAAGTPLLSHNPATTNASVFNTVLIEPGAVVMHPGPHGEFSVLRFTAPAEGQYAISGSFFGSDAHGTTTDVHVLANGLTVLDGTVEGFGPVTGPSFDTTVTLGARGHLDFAVGFGANSNFLFDSTGLSVHIIRLSQSGTNATRPILFSVLSVAEQPVSGQELLGVALLKRWALSTDNTRIEVGLSPENHLFLLNLTSPRVKWNWIVRSSELKLLPRLGANDGLSSSPWRFQNATVDASAEPTLRLKFASAQPTAELTVKFIACRGPGPIHCSAVVHNSGTIPFAVGCPPSFTAQMAAPDDHPLTCNLFEDDGSSPARGLVSEEILDGYNHRITCTGDSQDFIPLAVVSDGDRHGVYCGVEWSDCRIAVNGRRESTHPKRVKVQLDAGDLSGYTTTLEPGMEFLVPPVFIGAYAGDLDAMGNSLRKYLFSHSMPEQLRRDAGYPKVRWNACFATGKTPGSWVCLGSKFTTLVDDIAPLGFEEVTIDIGWWKDASPEGGRPMGKVPDVDLDHWPGGMTRASTAVHQKAMSLSLYWSDNNDLSSEAGRIARTHAVERLYQEHHADVYRSDSVGGAVVGSGYARTAGLYQVLDDLRQRIPGFAWENCAGGGTIKDYGAMSRAIRIQLTDSYNALQSRQAFWCSSYAFPPIQLEGAVGAMNRTRRGSPAGIVFDFRSSSLGAALIWFDSPSGVNDQPWTAEEKAALARAVRCYKTKIRPLVRAADLYHILPRPDGRHWDGVEYYDPSSGKGMTALFKPKSDVITQMIHFKGLDPAHRYGLSFEDRSQPPVEKSGNELMGKGLRVTLEEQETSELVFFESTSAPAHSAVPTHQN